MKIIDPTIKRTEVRKLLEFLENKKSMAPDQAVSPVEYTVIDENGKSAPPEIIAEFEKNILPDILDSLFGRQESSLTDLFVSANLRVFNSFFGGQKVEEIAAELWEKFKFLEESESQDEVPDHLISNLTRLKQDKTVEIFAQTDLAEGWSRYNTWLQIKGIFQSVTPSEAGPVPADVIPVHKEIEHMIEERIRQNKPIERAIEGIDYEII